MNDFTVHYVERVDSTNTRLLDWAAQQNCHRVALVADEQTAGRGQRGRHWLAARNEALLCSVAWQFNRAVALDGLSLAVGCMVADVLCDTAGTPVCERLQLKWPNDLLIDETYKLGGILIETIASELNRRTAVIGIGINLRTPSVALSTKALPGIGLDTWLGVQHQRNDVLNRLLNCLDVGLNEFSLVGFAGFQERWWARAAYAKRRVNIELPDGEFVTGTMKDVTEQGALVIESERGLHTLVSGEVSLRVSA